MEKKLYTIYDVTLPMPISLKVAGAFAATGLPWWGLLAVINVPFGDFFMFYLFPPIGLAFMASKPIFQKKTLSEFLVSQIKYLLQPKRLAGLRPLRYKYNQPERIIIRIFRPNQKENQ